MTDYRPAHTLAAGNIGRGPEQAPDLGEALTAGRLQGVNRRPEPSAAEQAATAAYEQRETEDRARGVRMAALQLASDFADHVDDLLTMARQIEAYLLGDEKAETVN